ncbi:MAG: hypothetical protein OK457_05025 [Thaumarchaeota archaeon]|nr:hypothetical protein [Nitrososphaerota archaeon]
MNESVTLGHPAEFFREVRKIFSTIDGSMRLVTGDNKLELVKTPIEGVAKFAEELRGRFYYQITRTDYQAVGALAICGAIAGAGVELWLFNVQRLFYLIILGGFFALFVAGGAIVGVSKKQYASDLFLSLEGDAYQAKTVEPQGERVSVFSKAFLKTDWQPLGSTSGFPLEFAKKMEENKLKLDLEINRILPEFEWESSRIPSTENSRQQIHEA